MSVGAVDYFMLQIWNHWDKKFTNEAKFRVILPPSLEKISRNVASLNITCSWHVNLLHYEHWTNKRKYFYEKLIARANNEVTW